MTPLRKLPACFLLLLCSFPLSAADWYRVEVVLFAYTEPDADDEWWYEAPGLPSRAQTISLITKTADPLPADTPDSTEPVRLVPYLALPRQDYRLAGVRRVLASSKEHRQLLHAAWQQPGLGAEDVRAVRLENTRLDSKTARRQQSEPEQEQAQDQPEYAPPKKVYDGIIRLRTSRFLHLDVDIAYFPDVLEQPSHSQGRPAADYVRLTETRRIKLKELHYFDHPLFGVIVQVERQLSADESPR